MLALAEAFKRGLVVVVLALLIVLGFLVYAMFTPVTVDNLSPRLWTACHGYRLAAKVNSTAPSLVWGRYLDCACARDDIKSLALEVDYAALLETFRLDGWSRGKALLAVWQPPEPIAFGPGATRALQSMVITVAKCQRPFS